MNRFGIMRSNESNRTAPPDWKPNPEKTILKGGGDGDLRRLRHLTSPTLNKPAPAKSPPSFAMEFRRPAQRQGCIF